VLGLRPSERSAERTSPPSYGDVYEAPQERASYVGRAAGRRRAGVAISCLTGVNLARLPAPVALIQLSISLGSPPTAALRLPHALLPSRHSRAPAGSPPVPVRLPLAVDALPVL